MQRPFQLNAIVLPLAMAIAGSTPGAQATQDTSRESGTQPRQTDKARASRELTGDQPAGTGKAGASRYQTGMALLNRGLNDAAEKELRSFLEENPTSKDAANAHYALGIALSRLSRFADAATELSKIISLTDFTYAPDAALLLSQCQVKLGRDADALTALDALARSAKDFARHDEAAAMRAECLQRLGRHQDVIAALSGFADRWPSSKAAPRAMLVLAMSEAALSKHADAASHAESVLASKDAGDLTSRAALIAARAHEALGERPKARPLYDRASTTDDRAIAAEALVAAARLARLDQDLTSAINALDRFEALATTKNATALPPMLQRWARYERARQRLDAGDAKGALALLDELSRSLAPADATGDAAASRRAARDEDSLREQAAYWAARCEAALAQFDNAAARLEQLRQTMPNGSLAGEALFDLASAHAKAGRADQAIAAYREFLKAHPKHAWAGDASLGLASGLLSQGAHAQAAEVCEHALAAAPTTKLAPSLTLLLAEARFAAKDYAKASDAYASYLNTPSGDTTDWRAGVRRALCLLRTNQPNARETLRVALDATLPPSLRDDPATTALLASSLSELADAQAAAEDWPASIDSYARLVSLRGEATEPQDLLRLGISLRRTGRAKDAIEPLTKAVAATRVGARGADDATNSAARLELAQAQISLNDLTAAEASLTPLVGDTHAPSNDAARATRVTALRLMASLESKQGDASKAAAHLAAAASLGGDRSPELLLDQGLALLNAGALEKAATVFADFLSHNPTSPRRDEASARLAIVYSRQGKHEQAAALFATLKPDSLAPSLRDAARYEHAMTLATAGKHDEARARLEALAATAMDDSVKLAATIELSRQLLDAGKPHDALARLERIASAANDPDARKAPPPGHANASRIDPLLARATYYRAAALLKLDRPRDAASLLTNDASRFATTDIAPAAALLTADALSRSGQLDESLRTLTALLAANPPASLRSAALLLQGDVAAAAQRWSDCERAYSVFLADFAGSDLWFRARFGLGQALEAQSKHAAAIDAYRDVVARHSGATAARAQFQIGECLVALGKHQDAITELVKVDAAYAEPEWSAAALYEVGRVLVMLKRPDDAARQFDEVVSRFPDSQWAAMARNERTKLAPAALPGRRNAAATPAVDPASLQGDR